MKRLTIILFLLMPVMWTVASSDPVPSGEALLMQLQKRDSVLVADQMLFGFDLDSVMPGDRFALPDIRGMFGDTLVLVRGWQADTLSRDKASRMRKGRPLRVRLSVVFAPFEEGRYILPDLPLVRQRDGDTDTLLFTAPQLDVKTMPVDTATFEIHDIKGQMRYPLTPAEVLPYIALVWLVALIGIAIWIVLSMRTRRSVSEASREPAYVVALRGLDKYRGDKYWAPERQKAMYSGITDTLRTYIESRFDINAEEMTTAEIFDALKGSEDLTPDLYTEAKELFELSDFVKFAKHTASDEENARAVPVAVRFVTSTYQSQLDAEAAQEGREE